ncbi:MAG: Flp pilus assembly protein CpaB [Elusimicrobia bacterium]|nr:Flp pilus assembly protein CpaB [Elusimicrobiota bacterium]
MDKKGLLIPILIAVVAAFIYWIFLTSKESAIVKSYDTANVLIARTDLPSRTLMREDLVEIAQVPRKFMQQDSYEVRSPSDLKLVSNMVTTIRIPKGNQITISALTNLGPDAGISVKVPPGYRASVITVPNELLMLVKPGDRVDVLVTFDALIAENKREKVTVTILQSVQVIGVGSNLGQGLTVEQARQRKTKESDNMAFSDKGALALALSPQESQYLALSRRYGEIDVIVRGIGESALYPIEVASFKKLFKI